MGFPQGKAIVIRELAITRNRGPRRHVARDHVRADRSLLKPGLLIGLEWKGGSLFRVTHDAVLVQDAHDFAIE